MITITVNGKEQKVEPGTSLDALLQTLKLNAACVAIECNREVIEREAFASTEVVAGDALEIVQFVGGG